MLIPILILTAAAAATNPSAEIVSHKLDAIESGQAKPGSVIVFAEPDLNAWVRAKAPTVVPQGFREPHLQLGDGTAIAYALVDFLKVRHSAGIETNWLIAKLIQGEKPVVAKASLESANGRATVHLQRAEIGGLAVSGAVLDFLIRNFVLTIFPEVKIDEPFDLDYDIDRIEIRPDGVRVTAKR